MKNLVKGAQQGDRLFFHCACGAFYRVYYLDFTVDLLIPLVSGHSRELSSKDSDHNSVNDKDQGVTVLFLSWQSLYLFFSQSISARSKRFRAHS
jgi:hypothetical protein